MKTMIELFSRDEVARLERRRKAGAALACAAAVLGLIACILLCRATTTANAAQTERAAVATAIVSGWLAIGFATLVAADAKREAGHAQMLLDGERAAVPGKVSVGRERLRIRNSVTIRKVQVENGKGTRKLNVNERKAKALQAAGEDITLYAVNGYAVAYETETPPAAQPRARLHARLWRKFFAQFPLYVLWLIVGAMFWSWIFTFITDTKPENKVTVFVDAYAVEDTALAVALERELPEGIRMVKVHPVSYVMFDDAGFLNADLFIVRVSDVEDYIGAFAPLPSPSEGAYLHEGVPYGIRLYDAAADDGPAREYISYTLPGVPREDYYLFFGAKSLHTGETDRAAYEIYEQLLKLK